MFNLRRLLFPLASLMVAGLAQADDYELYDLYEDPRSLGLGRAITAYTDDYNALYHNPAGLGLIEEWSVHAYFSFDASLNVLGITTDARDAFKQAEAGGNEAYQDALQILDPYKNKKAYGRGDWGVFWTWADGPFFLDQMGMGFYLQMNSHSTFHEALNSLKVDLQVDGHFVFGKAVSFLRDDSLRVGFSTRLGYRMNLDTTGDLLLAFANSDGSSPFRYNSNTVDERVWTDIDVGIQYDLPFLKRYRPRVGMGLKNILNQYSLLEPSLTTSNAPGDVHIYLRHINVGLSTALPAFMIFEPNLIFDVKHLGIRSEDFLNRVHIGVEVKLLLFDWWKGSVRMGLDQGYFTAGGFGLLGTRGFKGTVDVVYYGREVGVFPGQNVDHRFLLQFGIEI